jgi:DNA-binding transcriptional regulator YhcF (GntR family)
MDFSGKKPIFIELADYYAHLIELGAFKVGDYLPSVREVGLNEGINPNTVARSFQLLVEQGYVVSVPKKGYRIEEKPSTRKDLLHKAISDLLKEGYTEEEIIQALKETKND